MDARTLEKMFPAETAILRLVGKLAKDEADDFSNVFNHCMAVGVAAEVILSNLGFPKEITGAAILHDLKKRFEKRPQDFTAKEAEILEAVWGLIPEDLRNATPPLTRETAAQNITLRSKVLNLADMWTLGDRVVGLAKRREGSMARWPQLDWDFHLEWGAVLELRIWEELERRGIVSGKQDLLLWVTSQIE